MLIESVLPPTFSKLQLPFLPRCCHPQSEGCLKLLGFLFLNTAHYPSIVSLNQLLAATTNYLCFLEYSHLPPTWKNYHLTYEFRRTNQYYLAEFFFAATKVLKLIPKSLSKPSSV